jgi:hypothetical protein
MRGLPEAPAAGQRAAVPYLLQRGLRQMAEQEMGMSGERRNMGAFQNSVRGKAPRTPKIPKILPPGVSALGEAQEQYLQGLLSAYLDGRLCVACLKPCSTFALIAGSNDFYMCTLGELGAQPHEALALTMLDRDQLIRRAPVCFPCARKSKVTVVSYAEIRAQSGDDPHAAVHVPVIAETAERYNAVMKIINAVREQEDRQRDRQRQKQEKYEMAALGATKEVRQCIERLEKRGYVAVLRQGSGNWAIYPPGSEGERVPSITTISSTPGNAGRAVRNAEAYVRKWERENLEKKEEEEMPPAGARREKYVTRTPVQWAAIIGRYDEATPEGRRALLAKEGIRHIQVRDWRAKLAEEGWVFGPARSEPDDQDDHEQMCESCVKDKALTHDNFPVIDGHFSRKCHDCTDRDKALANIAEAQAAIADDTVPLVTIDQVVKPVEVSPDGTIRDGHARVAAAQAAGIEVKPEIHDPDDEAQNVIRLMSRQRAIKARLGEIETEMIRRVKELEEEMKRVTKELNEEKTSLSDELNKVQTALFDVVTG